MHGLINKALQAFICDAFGADAWEEILHRSGADAVLGSDGFEAMQLYDDGLTVTVLATAAQLLRRSRDALLEDLGTYLISGERQEPLRRLLRFGGVSFTDFLFSLDDLQGRSHLAVPELGLPELSISEVETGGFSLACRDGWPGFGHVLVGALRALADDYGALVVLEHHGTGSGTEEVIAIEVHDPAYYAGRRFDLAVEGR
ncbi:heme NO-binding domain-containing protein [Pararhodobacter zhoushanensis]|uniref:heme NO-binding domain-containing protein n=1 Tax=Pararhodobacter zhoushanensis TaxID=2479545 RepID=UPI000F8DDDFD|nr:heme NO-binding domain-containing protein [Pararhodobacter zhoushanensis]